MPWTDLAYHCISLPCWLHLMNPDCQHAALCFLSPLICFPHPEARGSRGPSALLLLLLSQGKAVAAAAKPRRRHQRPGRRWVNSDPRCPLTSLFPGANWMDTCATYPKQTGVINQPNPDISVCVARFAPLWCCSASPVCFYEYMRVRGTKAVLCPV